MILGTNQTSEWFTAGFEDLVDGAKWELLHAHSAFVELWADANSAVWKEPIGSRCTQNPTAPDRVIFLALAGGPGGGLSNYPLEKWMPLLTADIKNIQAKYPEREAYRADVLCARTQQRHLSRDAGASYGRLSQSG